MSADDLVVRLQATLDETEARANAEGHHDPDEGGYYACPATRSEPLGDLPWGEDACTCGLAKRRADTLRLVQAHRDLIALFPVSAPHLDTEGSFYGFQSRDCGEHRTVGPHRAWCYDCSEWCYPNEPCRRCHGVSEVLRILARGYGIEDQTAEEIK